MEKAVQSPLSVTETGGLEHADSAGLVGFVVRNGDGCRPCFRSLMSLTLVEYTPSG